MANFSIGISGLEASQRALDIIGNNVANAATEGYHKQRLNLSPAYGALEGSVIIGGGVEVGSVTRMVDNLLEKELLRQNSLLEQVSQEYTTLRTVENALGEFSGEGGGLNAAIDDFFNAFADLSANVGEAVWQNQVITSAETLASQFRMLGDFLSKLDSQIVLEAENLVERANVLINQIARLNSDIERMEIGGSQANNLRDKRDQLISELSGIIGVETLERDFGVMDVEAGGLAVVIGTRPTEFELGTTDDGYLGITAAGALNYTTSVQGGRLGALISLKNTILREISSEVDALASAIIQKVNEYHVQGLGPAGSFTRLDGWPVTTEVLSEWDPPITDGKIYIRVTDTSAGTIDRYEIDLSSITPSNPSVGLTLSDVADEIDSLTGLNSWVDASGLHIEASASNYKFDFLPAVLPEPTYSVLTGSSPPEISVSGIYEGSENDTFGFFVSGAGSVGNGTLELIVRDGSGQVIKTLNIGEGYAAGDILEVGNGIRIALGPGDFAANNYFQVDAFASTDTSGLLAAAGINTFFSGTGAADIEVCSEIANDPSRLASALGADMNDNYNANRLSHLKDEAISSLEGMTIGNYYRKVVADTGQQISIREIQQGNIAAIVQNLENQRNEISGVDINSEAAQMLIFQQMFQSMAKYMGVVKATLDSVIEIL